MRLGAVAGLRIQAPGVSYIPATKVKMIYVVSKKQNQANFLSIGRLQCM